MKLTSRLFASLVETAQCQKSETNEKTALEGKRRCSKSQSETSEKQHSKEKGVVANHDLKPMKNSTRRKKAL